MRKEHILIIRFSAMGDVAMAVPVVYSLAKQYPNIRITVLSRRYARAFFADLAPNVCFMEAEIKTEYKGFKGLNALYRRLAAKNFTAIADFHGVLRSRYLRMRFNLSGYRVRHINKHRDLRKSLVSQTAKNLRQLPTSFENYAKVLADLGYPIKLDFDTIFPEGTGNLNLLPAVFGPKKDFEKWIGIAPFAAHSGKIYPTEKMEAFLEGLLADYPNARVFLFGKGKQESEWFGRWINRFSQCLQISSNVENIMQELIVMSHLDVMVSMDSANMHMASIVGTPVVSVWGATHPFAGFMGWKQDEANAVQVDLPCRPCSIYGKRPCARGDFQCMNAISPEMIEEKVKALLS